MESKLNFVLREKKLFSVLVACGVLGFLGWKIWSDWETVATFRWNFSFLDIILFLIFLPLPFLFNVVAWHLVTVSQGEKIAFSKNFKLWMFSNFARYLPGGIWQYPSRVFLLSREGVAKESGVKCLVLEALFVFFTGLLIVFLLFVSRELNLTFQGTGLTAEQGVLLMVLILFFLALFFSLIKSQKFMSVASRLLVLVSGKRQAIQNINISFAWVPILVFAYFLAFLFPSVILFFIIKGTIMVNLSLLPVFLGAYTASWLLGYVAFFAPAGIGVREATLATFLSVYMPFSVAAVVVITLRVTLFVSEALGFGFAFLLTKRST